MTYQEAEYWIARISSGIFSIKVRENKYYVRPLTQVERMEAASIYIESNNEAFDQGMMDDDDYTQYILKYGFWTKEKEKMLIDNEKEIENVKVRKYEKFLLKTERELAAEILEKLKEHVSSLQNERNCQINMKMSYIAQCRRDAYVVGRTLMKKDLKTQVWIEDEFWNDNTLLDEALAGYYEGRAKEESIRKLARSDYWRSIWACGENESSVFGRPAAELTDEQRHLIAWTRIYDNARKHDEPPSNEVMDDDDAFDGWMIMAQKNVGVTKGTSQKIMGAQEVFIVAKSPEEIQEIENLNSRGAKIIKAERNKIIDEKGSVADYMLPDRLREIKMEIANRKKE